MAESSPNLAAKPAATQARLILQDPLAFDQATRPVLRGSMEMVTEPVPVMEREKARELWESLSLEPEVAQERQSERKRLLARADSLAREAAAAKAQTVELQAQLSKARDERLNHPLVYAGAVGLLGLGAMWWLERRKRVHLQDRELEMLAQQTPELTEDKTPHSYLHETGSVFSLEDSPDLASDFSTDLSGVPSFTNDAKKLSEYPDLQQGAPASIPTPHLTSIETASVATPVAETTQSGVPKITPAWALPRAWHESGSLPTEEELVVLSRKEQDRSLLGMSKRVLSNMLTRRSRQDVLSSTLQQSRTAISAMSSSVASSTLVHADSDNDNVATQMLFDDEAQLAFEQELLEQQLQAGIGGQIANYDPDQVNIELLSQTRTSPNRGESAIEHLLELRTAVTGLCVLGRPEGAARLLEEHIAADPGTCAWAYLEYMHICEQIDQRDKFESMRKQYRVHFNRMAPYWHEPNANVLGLSGYARAANELCAAWTQGREHAHYTLASWLAGPLLGRKLVQLPAYHDLFDLYELLEFVQDDSQFAQATSDSANAQSQAAALSQTMRTEAHAEKHFVEQDFVPTVSLLDLDYEFSSDVTLEEREVQESEKAVTVVKTGNFAVDFNVAGTQMGGLPFMPAELDKK